MIKSLIHSMIVCPDMQKAYPRLTHGEGAYVFDEAGNKYLDASSGSSAVSNLGHGRAEMAEVIKEQVGKITVLPTHAFSSPIVEDYLDELVAFAPEGFARAWIVMSGTEAVENAIKLALQYHQLRGDSKRFKVISRWGTYHGNSVFTLDVGGMKFRRQSYSQWMNNFPHVSPAYAYRRPANLSEPEYVQELLVEFEECLLQADPATVVAFVAEPVVAAALGAVPPPEGYFAGIYRICQKYGILFVADEILTGFGRTGKNFGMEHFDVTPDIIAAGKGISGGYYPMSAVLATEKVMKPFVDNNAPFMGGHTFACNPVAAAAGSNVLKIIKDEDLVNNARIMGQLLMEKLNRLYKYDIVGDVRGIGLLCGVELVRDRQTKAPFPAELNVSKRIGQKSIDRGVILYPGKGSADGTLGDHVMIVPPLTITEQQVDEIVDTLETCIAEVTVELGKVAHL
jgi:adenosylmethionine-8-amino-7-oxononanoate aminotransferase